MQTLGFVNLKCGTYAQPIIHPLYLFIYLFIFYFYFFFDFHVYSPEKWLHNWIATGPNKFKKLTRLTSPAHTTHGKVRINPLKIWVVMQLTIIICVCVWPVVFEDLNNCYRNAVRRVQPANVRGETSVFWMQSEVQMINQGVVGRLIPEVLEPLLVMCRPDLFLKLLENRAILSGAVFFW